ncbi:MAG: aldehyde dehydrogenase [Pseudomonadota bacterium]
MEDAVNEINLLIDNEDAPAADGGTFVRKSPVTAETASTAAAGGAADVDAAVQAAHRAFPEWAAMGPAQRRAILSKCAETLDAKAPEFVALGAAETGGTAPWIGFNVMLAANMLREAAAMTTQIKGEIIPANKPGTLSMGYRQPCGVLVGMAPWNAPVILAVRSFAMPLACGNTVVMKASEKCPGIHRLIGDCMVEAGLPKGVLNIVTHSAEDGPEVVGALIDHPLTRRINFTGSTRVGQIIAERAAKHLKPCLLELGGKAPLIVLEDADLEGAVNAAIFGAFMNQGQICMSTEKVIVVDEIYDAFTARFAERAAALKTGLPNEQVHIASVVDRDTIDHVARLIEDAVAKGAEVLTGGAPAEGTIMPATIVAGVTKDMDIYAAESFGPVTTLIRASDEEQALEIANDTEYGLTGAVFSRNIPRALEIAKRMQTGIAHINGPTVGDEAQMPFGGTKASGYGRFGGTAAVDAFTELRWITIEDPGQHYPI